MSEYQHNETIERDPQQVFDFICEIRNLPQFVPTLHEAAAQGPGRVRVRGQADGRPYDTDGFLKVDAQRMRLDWGSDGEHQYRGWMQVKDGGNGNRATVSVHLSFEPAPKLAERLERQTGDRDQSIHNGLREALQSLKNLCEGHGGKVPSRAEQGSHARPGR